MPYAMKLDLRMVLALLCAAGLAPLVAGASEEPGAAGEAAPLALTPTEYNNTVADLLGFPRNGERWPKRPSVADRISPRRTASKGVFSPPPPPDPWPWPFPAEPGADGFEGIAQGQSPSSYQVEELHLAGMHFGAFALLSPTFFDCPGWSDLPSAEREACAATSILRFGERAYRRPLRDGERGRIKAFWQAQLAAEPIDEAVALTVAGILQAPAFHFKLEPDPTEFDAWQLATRLSYFLWDSMPDEELFRAAGSGELASTEGIERQARRMLDDPKARPAVVHFHHQWLGTDQVLLIAPARRAFGPRFGVPRVLRNTRDDDTKWPAILGPIRHSMRLETELFVEEAIFDRAGTFTELMTGNHGYMSRGTAPIYGATTTEDEGRAAVTRQIEYVSVSVGRKRPLTLDPVVLDPTQRAGVLTLPSVLAIGAYAVQPGPIPRGVRILERVACMEMGDPIEGVESALPPDALGVESTNRERTAAATKPSECNSCHRRINPAGFAFEHYDAMGAWRAEDNGQPVDASGSLRLPGAEELTFADGVEFAHKLAASRRVRDCYALHWTRYALGSHLERNAPGLEPIQKRFRENDSVKELMVSIATSDLFRARSAGVGSEGGP
ncbi:MAG: DUF1592 domain-containing protein [Holophagales bacterium]|nr:DUF1592 domain-containing protein [Holophagales bacterium]MYI81027.1 DUF1592 domain-containing protein [Holophagales bacterium]